VGSLLLLAASVKLCALAARPFQSQQSGALTWHNLHKKNMQWVRFIAKTRGCCCNLSVGVALTVWFSYGQYMKMTRDEHVGYLDLNLATFQHLHGLGCYHFCLSTFGLELIIFFELLCNFRFNFGAADYITFDSVLGLQVNTGLQPPTCWEPFVAGTMLRRPEPTKERVEPTILSIIAIEITHLTRFALLLQLQIQRYLWRNHVATWV